MSIGGFGPSDFDEYWTEETVPQENERLKRELTDLTLAYTESLFSLKWLVEHCKKNGLNPFPEGPVGLQEALKLIREMKPEELKKRNEEATRRIVPRVKNPESLKMKDAMEAQETMIKEFKEDPLLMLLSDVPPQGTRIISREEYLKATQQT